MKWRNAIILLILFGAVIGTVWFNLPQEKEVTSLAADCKGEVRAEIGFCAPNFTLETMDGKQKVELYKNNGKPTFINFWASWCGPCKEEMPYIEEAYNKYKDQVNFLMVNETATELGGAEEAYDYIMTHEFSFPVLLDKAQSDGAGKKTVGFDQYRLIGVPMTFVVAPDGKISHKIAGGMTKKQLDALMKEITD